MRPKPTVQISGKPDSLEHHDAFTLTIDGVEKLLTEPFSTNIGRCLRVNCFLLVDPNAFWRFALLASANSWAFFNGIYCFRDFVITLSYKREVIRIYDRLLLAPSRPDSLHGNGKGKDQRSPRRRWERGTDRHRYGDANQRPKQAPRPISR
jgi:hypothetical protein